MINDLEKFSLNSPESSLTSVGFMIKSVELRSDEFPTVVLLAVVCEPDDLRPPNEFEFKESISSEVFALVMSTLAGSIAPISPKQEPKLKLNMSRDTI